MLKNIAINLCFISTMFFINKMGLYGNILFFMVAGILVFRSSEGAVKAVSLTMLVLIGNAAFVEKTDIFTVLKFGVIALSMVRLLLDMRRTGNQVASESYFKVLLAFICVSALLSIINDYYVMVSMLKLVSFGIGFTVIIAGSEMLRRRGTDLYEWYYSVIIFTLLAGMLAWWLGVGFNAKTDLTYFKGLFNGPFYHPQTLGPACAMMIVYISNMLMYTRNGRRWLSIGLIFSLLIVLYMTSSRTGLVALIVGLTVSIGSGFVAPKHVPDKVKMNMSGINVVMLLVLFLAAFFVSDLHSERKFSRALVSYMMKTTYIDKGYDLSDISREEFFRSRQWQLDMMKTNIENNLLTGIGFGTSTERGFGRRAGMLSAPTEKGFLPIAIIEEAGLIGAAVFWIFVIQFYKYLFRQGNIPGVGMFTTLLAVNLGEMSFFSFGGQGGFLWVLVGGGLALGSRTADSVVPQEQEKVSNEKYSSVNYRGNWQRSA